MPTCTIRTKHGNAVARAPGPTPEAAEREAWAEAMRAYGHTPSADETRFWRCVRDMRRCGFVAVAVVEIRAIAPFNPL